MTQWLRQSTAGQEVSFGQALDNTDGDTEEGGLTIANTDIKLHKEGATTLSSKNSGGATYISNGVYYCVLDATDSNTLGKMSMYIHVAGALSLKETYMVVPAMIYDSMVLGTDRLDTNVTHVADTAQTANDNGADINTLLTRIVGTLAAGTHNPATAAQIAVLSDWINGGRLDLILDELTTQGDTNETAIGALNNLSAAQVNAESDIALTDFFTSPAALVDLIYEEAVAGHLTAGTMGLYLAVAGGIIVDTTATGTPTATEIQFTGGVNGVNFYEDQKCWVFAGTGIGQTKPIISSSYSAGTTTLTFDEPFVVAAVSGDRVLIQADHVHSLTQMQSGISTLVATDIVSNGAITTSAGAVANVDLVDTCTTNTDMVAEAPTVVQNRQEMDSNSTQLAAIVADTADMQPRIGTMETDINNLDLGLIYGTAATGTLTTTSATTNLTGYADNQLTGAYIVVTSGAAEGERREITNYTEIGGIIEFAAMTIAMANNDTFKIV